MHLRRYRTEEVLTPLKVAQKLKGVKVEALAEKFGYSPVSVRRALVDPNLHVKLAIELAHELCVSLDEVFPNEAAVPD